MLTRFHWTTFDVHDLLPPDWRQDALAVAADADCRAFPRTPILTREGPEVTRISRGRVHADQVRVGLPWLHRLYHDAFRELAEQAVREPVRVAEDGRYGVVLNVQRGTDMRFECHVDSNPLSGLLFLTNHEAGGELVVSHDRSASSRTELERDCSVIRPHAGHLVLFDARQFPHYARPLAFEQDIRVLAAMNFYTRSFPESTRPRELNHYLYGDAL